MCAMETSEDEVRAHASQVTAMTQQRGQHVSGQQTCRDGVAHLSAGSVLPSRPLWRRCASSNDLTYWSSKSRRRYHSDLLFSSSRRARSSASLQHPFDSRHRY